MMERLTVEYCVGEFLPRKMCSVGRDGLVDDIDNCIECCEENTKEDDMCSGCPIQECFNRLAKYENTGLAPEQIIEMDSLYQELGKEVMAYRKIDTVEECREAIEWQRGKKPIKDEYNHDCCPNCGWIVYKDEYGGRHLPHCENCGQAIDWSDIR